MSFEISMIVRTSIVLVCAGIISLVTGRRASAAGRHRIWSIAIWAVLALPTISWIAPKVEVPVLPAREAPRAIGEFHEVDTGSFIVPLETSTDVNLRPRTGNRESAQPVAPHQERSWDQWLLLAWGLGALVVLARSVLGFWEVRRLRRHSAVAAGNEWKTWLSQLQAELGVSRPVELRTTDEGIPPITWGVFRPVILMPSVSTRWTEMRRRLVLAHELSHVKRKDGQTQIVAQLACSLYWFNPLVWYAAHRLRIERERACDDCVLSLGAEADDYADHLLQIARTLNSGLSFATVSMAHPSDLEMRLSAILDPLTTRGAFSRFGSAALVLFLAFLTATTAVLQLTALAPMIMPAFPPPPPAPLSAPAEITAGSKPQQPAGSASISGAVSKMGSGEALPGTRVELIKSPGGNTAAYSAVASTDGSFLFNDVQPGEYRVIATREDGLLPAEYGQKSPNVRGLPVIVHPADAIKNIRIAMAPPGAISGRVFDHDGDPVGNARVQALKTTYWQGRRGLTIAESVQTNDVGEYRLYWLPPGQYYVTAKPIDIGARSAQVYIRPPSDRFYHDETTPPVVSRRVLESGETREEVYPPAYYPGTPDVNAARPIAVNAGENLIRMDIMVSTPVAARHVFGTVIDASTGQPAAGAALRAIPRDGDPSVVIPNATANGNGEFNLSGLAPGSYYLFASLPAKTGGPGVPSGAAGRVPLEVGTEDLRNVTVMVPPPFDLPGRFVVDGKTDLDFDITRLRVYLRHDPDVLGTPPAVPPTRPGGPDPGATQTDGSFILSGIGPGDYKLSATYTGVSGTGPAPPGMRPGTYLKSFRLGNADVLNGGLHLNGKPEGPLEIVIGTTQAEINGSVVNEKSEGVPNAFAVLVPDQPLRHRMDLYKSVGTDSSGRFTMRSIAPGGYTLLAFVDVQNGSWFDPDFMKDFESRGTHLEINEATKENRQLIVIEPRR